MRDDISEQLIVLVQQMQKQLTKRSTELWNKIRNNNISTSEKQRLTYQLEEINKNAAYFDIIDDVLKRIVAR